MLNSKGHEIPDQTPVALPLGYKKPESLQQTIRRLIQTQASLEAQQNGFETFEEANDFIIGDDYDPRSEYEVEEDKEFMELLTKETTSPEVARAAASKEPVVETATK